MTFFSGCFFVPFDSKFHPSGVKLDPFRTTKSSTAVSQNNCKPLGFYPLKQREMLDNFVLGAFLSLLIQNFTFPVSNLTHLGPLSPPPPCFKRSAAQTTWILPLKTNTECLSNFRLAPFSALLAQNFTFRFLKSSW